MRQAEAFLNGEGDKYHERNRHKELNPRILDAISDLPIKPASILEIGCGDGRYLNELAERFRPTRCIGIDPSAKAIEEGHKKYPALGLIKGDARYLHIYEDALMDLIVFGFCLYLVDREQIFDIVTAADRGLRPGGHLAIHDFDIWEPKTVPYKHMNGIYSYKMDYPALWLANPSYTLVSKTITGPETAMTILRKDGWERFK